MIKKIKYITHNFAQGIRFVNYMFYRFNSRVSSKNTDEDLRFGAMGLSNAVFGANVVAGGLVLTKMGLERFDLTRYMVFLVMVIVFLTIMTHKLVYTKDKHIAIFARFKEQNKRRNKFFFYVYLLCSALIFLIYHL